MHACKKDSYDENNIIQIQTYILQMTLQIILPSLPSSIPKSMLRYINKCIYFTFFTLLSQKIRRKIAKLEGTIYRSNVSKIIFDCMCLNFGKLLQIPKLINHNPITQKIVEKSNTNYYLTKVILISLWNIYYKTMHNHDHV